MVRNANYLNYDHLISKTKPITMRKHKQPESAQNTFCELKHTMETLYWSMIITPDNIQALIKVQTLKQLAQKLETQLQNEIDKNYENEI